MNKFFALIFLLACAHGMQACDANTFLRQMDSYELRIKSFISVWQRLEEYARRAITEDEPECFLSIKLDFRTKANQLKSEEGARRVIVEDEAEYFTAIKRVFLETKPRKLKPKKPVVGFVGALRPVNLRPAK